MTSMTRKNRWIAIVRWFDASTADAEGAAADKIDWLRVVPFIAMHVVCLGVIWVGVSPIALIVAAALYTLRMFAITAFYHLLFAQGIQDIARRAIHLRPDRRQLRATRAVVVGLASSQSSSARRYREGPALAHATRILA